MEQLLEKSNRKVYNIDMTFVRSIIDQINWDSRLIGIKGARGVGKTTLMLQYMKGYLQDRSMKLYLSLDSVWFADNRLVDVVDWFVKLGGEYLFLDEVHKYPRWSQEIKNIYDDYPDLKIVFTGSSLLEILNARADLSRRAVVYSMQGLSFREFIMLQKGISLPIFTLEEILHRHKDIALEITAHLKPLKYLSSYFEQGYYPFYREQPALYSQKLEEVVSFILEVELPLLRNIEVSYVPKLKQLLQVIADSVPFVPNVSKLSDRIQINRNTLVTYLFYMQQAQLIRNLYQNSKGITRLQKPDKIYLENTNFIYILKTTTANIGNIRETFFLNQVSNGNEVTYSSQGDFVVNNKLTFEVGGKNKKQYQIKTLDHAYIVSDNLEIGYSNKIPLWLFGFLY